MKILVLGLEGATPELLFGDERLTNFRRLMENGCYGKLESVIPCTPIPAWMCMATSQDPGALGVYGPRNRTDYSYGDLQTVDSQSLQTLAIWDHIGRTGKRVVLGGVPPSYPPLQVQGACIGCYMTPNIGQHVYTHPTSLQQEIATLVGEYPVDVQGSRTAKQDWLKDAVYDMSRKHFTVLRHLLQQAPWEYCQCVEIGLDRLQHGFWKFHDVQHVL
jgi:predicted AlkP superfamily phosphohydrolase/phosphomutase